MYIRTELLDSILTSEQGKELLENVPPIYSDGYVALWLFQTMGVEFDNLMPHLEEMEAQTNPLTATWALKYWEDALGLKTNEGMDEERRRSIVVDAWRHTSMPPARLEGIISNITGTGVSITERTDAGGNDNPYSFVVTLDGEVSESVVEEVRNKINMLKPSHLVFDIVTA